MIRFVDLGRQLSAFEDDPNWPRQFAFYDTISDQFLIVNGGSAFDSWREFLAQAELDLSPAYIERLQALCPKWVLK